MKMRMGGTALILIFVATLACHAADVLRPMPGTALALMSEEAAPTQTVEAPVRE